MSFLEGQGGADALGRRDRSGRPWAGRSGTCSCHFSPNAVCAVCGAVRARLQ